MPSVRPSLSELPAERIALLDLLRGVAVCGILFVNILVMGTVGSTEGRRFPATWSPDWIAWSLQQLLLEGAMRGLFTMLFGAGMVLMLQRAERTDGLAWPLDIWVRRCWLLLALGLFNFAVLMWPGEILWTYGVAGLALLGFRRASVRTLWTCVGLLMALLSAHRAYYTASYQPTYRNALAGEQALAAGRPLTDEQRSGLSAVEAIRAENHPSEGARRQEIEQRTHLGTLWRWSAQGWSERHLEFYSWIGVAESFAFMLAGMALLRSGVLAGNAETHTYWLLLLGGGGFGLAVRIGSLAWQAQTAFELDTHRLYPVASILSSGGYQPARLALTLAYVGLFALLMRRRSGIWMSPLRALGRMALTVYTLQSAVTSLLFYAAGLVGKFGAADLML